MSSRCATCHVGLSFIRSPPYSACRCETLTRSLVPASGLDGSAIGSAGVSEVVVVTGSSSGIGRAVAERFARDGARVIVNSSRSVEEGEMVARSLPEAVYVQGDVSREEDARRLVAT